jgi:hypothetical protein
MLKSGGQDITPPPLDEDGNPLLDKNASIAETSTTPTMEELMKKIEKLNSELNKLTRKTKRMAPQVMMMIPHMKRKPSIKQRGTRKSVISPPIMLCILITITCLALRLTPPCRWQSSLF